MRWWVGRPKMLRGREGKAHMAYILYVYIERDVALSCLPIKSIRARTHIIRCWAGVRKSHVAAKKSDSPLLLLGRRLGD